MNHNFISELDDQRLDELLRYTPEFTEENLENIKKRCLQKKAAVRKPINRILIAAAIAVLAMAFSITALAATGIIDFGRFYNSLFNNPDAKGEIEIAQTSVSSGLEIKLISAFVDRHTAYYLIEITDIEGARLSDTISVSNGSFIADIHRYSTGAVIFDETRNKATVVLTVTYGYNIAERGMASLDIDTIMSGLRVIDDGVLGFDIAAHVAENEYVSLEEWHAMHGGGGGCMIGAGRDTAGRVSVDVVDGVMVVDGDWVVDGQIMLRPMLPGDMDAPIGGIDWAVVSGVGISDGLLHIIIKNIGEDPSDFVNSTFCIVDGQGNVIDWLFTAASVDYMYRDIMFDIGADAGPDDLAGLSLALRGSEYTGRQVYDNVIRGEWSISFPVEQEMQRRILISHPVNHPFFAKVEITCSPVRTIIQTTAHDVVVDENNAVIKLVDGYDEKTDEEKIELQQVFTSSLVRYHYGFDDPILTFEDGSTIALERPENMFDFYGGLVWGSTEYFDVEKLRSITFCGDEYFFNSNT